MVFWPGTDWRPLECTPAHAMAAGINSRGGPELDKWKKVDVWYFDKYIQIDYYFSIMFINAKAYKSV